MSSDFKETQHGRNHDPDIGSDPIISLRGALRFNRDNEGGFGYVQTNDCFDVDDYPNPLGVGGGPDSMGFAIQDGSGCGMVVGSVGLLQLIGSPVEVSSRDETLTITVGATSPVTFTFNHDGTITLPSGAVIGP